MIQLETSEKEPPVGVWALPIAFFWVLCVGTWWMAFAGGLI